MKPCVLTLLLITACSGSRSSGALPGPGAHLGEHPEAPPSAPVDDSAPPWARAEDARVEQGYRFICEGAGANEDEALQTARSICEDKICKLCGVEVESVVRTEESLEGVAMQRQVIERCRRVRRGDTPVARKVTDCYEGRCLAWVQIDYADEDRERECRALSDERYADPKVCQDTIEAFKNTQGYSAASFRERVRLIDEALTACAEIDVRPTPLMNALEEKLGIGMRTWLVNETPSYLRNHYLKAHPPLWDAFRQTDTFVERLQLLRGYLAHKVLVMNVHEAAFAERDTLDTPEGMQRLMVALGAIDKGEAYGVEHVHFLAAQRLRHLLDDHQLAQSPEPFCAFLRKTYPVDEVRAWNERIDLLMLFRADDHISDEEWSYVAKGSVWRDRSLFELLRTKDHGKGEKARLGRLGEALALASDDEAKKRPLTPKSQWAAAKRVIPFDGAFLLQAESLLPTEVRPYLTWDYFLDIYQRSHQDFMRGDETAYLARMEKLLRVPQDPKEARSFCHALHERLSFLEARGHRPQHASAQVCACLTGALAEDGTWSLTSKGGLYRRALAQGMACVAPPRF